MESNGMREEDGAVVEPLINHEISSPGDWGSEI